MAQNIPQGFDPTQFLATLLGENNQMVQGMQQFNELTAPFRGASRVELGNQMNAAEESAAQGDRQAMQNMAVLEMMLGMRGPLPQVSSQLPAPQPSGGFVDPAPPMGGANVMNILENALLEDPRKRAQQAEIERQRMGR